VCCWTTKALYNNRPTHNTGPWSTPWQMIFQTGRIKMSNQHFSGRCLCGAIQFKVAAKPLREVNCHCDDCRRATGSPYGALAFVPEEALTVNGETPGSYSHSSDRGSEMEKLFCTKCGSQLFTRNNARVGMMGVRIGVIDDASWFKPTVNVYRSRALPSTPIDGEINSFEKMSG